MFGVGGGVGGGMVCLRYDKELNSSAKCTDVMSKRI